MRNWLIAALSVALVSVPATAADVGAEKGYGRVAGTVLDYGVPDLAPLSPANESDQLRLAEMLAQRIAAYEPRLRDVRVVLAPSSESPVALQGRARCECPPPRAFRRCARISAWNPVVRRARNLFWVTSSPRFEFNRHRRLRRRGGKTGSGFSAPPPLPAPFCDFGTTSPRALLRTTNRLFRPASGCLG